AIARALVGGAKILLLDEPTGNLDKKNTAQILDLLQELSKTMLVVVVSHDEHRAEQYADRIIKLESGKVVEDALNTPTAQSALMQTEGVAVQVTEQDTPQVPSASTEQYVKESEEGIESLTSTKANTPADLTQVQGSVLQSPTGPTATQTAAKRKGKVKTLFFLKLGLSLIKKHKTRFVVSVLLPALLFSCVGVLFSMHNFDINRHNLQEMYAHKQENVFITNSWTSDYSPSLGVIQGAGVAIPLGQEQIQKYQGYGESWLVPSLISNEFGKGSDYAADDFYELTFALLSSRDILNEPGQQVKAATQGTLYFDNAQALDAYGARMVAGQFPQDDHGILITTRQYDALKKYGYRDTNDEDRPEGYTGEEIAQMTPEEFLAIEPQMEFFAHQKDTYEHLQERLNIVGIIDPQVSRDFYQYGVSSFTEIGYINQKATLSIANTLALQSIRDKYSATVVYDKMLVPLSGKMSRDMRYFDNGLTANQYGWQNGKFVETQDSVKLQTYAKTVFLHDIFDIRSYIVELRYLAYGLVAIFGIASIGMLANFVVTTINSNKKQIGVILSLGGGKRELFWIYCLESILAAIAIFAIGVLGSLGLNALMNGWWTQWRGYPTLQHGMTLGFLSILQLLASVAGIVLLSTAIPITKLLKKRPIDTIRAGSQ
ncbi:MAG: FtsX-like permease family protein, partial [Firmicutes bacterium]|nr:FtsX-like permease family protein [Bacillota bacterium]